MDQYHADFINYFKALLGIPVCLFWLYLIRPLYFILSIHRIYPENNFHFRISTEYEFSKTNLQAFIATILDPRNQLNKFTYYGVIPSVIGLFTALIWLFGKLF
ncbi:hypothetical protein DA2_0680 [Desulfovibrio sp. A2]|nr:hypothetical protein DA2_0680 [Desulfovibrio sp. A2]